MADELIPVEGNADSTNVGDVHGVIRLGVDLSELKLGARQVDELVAHVKGKVAELSKAIDSASRPGAALTQAASEEIKAAAARLDTEFEGEMGALAKRLGVTVDSLMGVYGKLLRQALVALRGEFNPNLGALVDFSKVELLRINPAAAKRQVEESMALVHETVDDALRRSSSVLSRTFRDYTTRLGSEQEAILAAALSRQRFLQERSRALSSTNEDLSRGLTELRQQFRDLEEFQKNPREFTDNEDRFLTRLANLRNQFDQLSVRDGKGRLISFDFVDSDKPETALTAVGNAIERIEKQLEATRLEARSVAAELTSLDKVSGAANPAVGAQLQRNVDTLTQLRSHLDARSRIADINSQIGAIQTAVASAALSPRLAEIAVDNLLKEAQAVVNRSFLVKANGERIQATALSAAPGRLEEAQAALNAILRQAEGGEKFLQAQVEQRRAETAAIQRSTRATLDSTAAPVAEWRRMSAAVVGTVGTITNTFRSAREIINSEIPRFQNVLLRIGEAYSAGGDGFVNLLNRLDDEISALPAKETALKNRRTEVARLQAEIDDARTAGDLTLRADLEKEHAKAYQQFQFADQAFTGQVKKIRDLQNALQLLTVFSPGALGVVGGEGAIDPANFIKPERSRSLLASIYKRLTDQLFSDETIRAAFHDNPELRNDTESIDFNRPLIRKSKAQKAGSQTQAQEEFFAALQASGIAPEQIAALRAELKTTVANRDRFRAEVLRDLGLDPNSPGSLALEPFTNEREAARKKALSKLQENILGPNPTDALLNPLNASFQFNQSPQQALQGVVDTAAIVRQAERAVRARFDAEITAAFERAGLNRAQVERTLEERGGALSAVSPELRAGGAGGEAQLDRDYRALRIVEEKIKAAIERGRNLEPLLRQESALVARIQRTRVGVALEAERAAGPTDARGDVVRGLTQIMADRLPPVPDDLVNTVLQGFELQERQQRARLLSRARADAIRRSRQAALDLRAFAAQNNTAPTLLGFPLNQVFQILAGNQPELSMGQIREFAHRYRAEDQALATEERSLQLAIEELDKVVKEGGADDQKRRDEIAKRLSEIGAQRKAFASREKLIPPAEVNNTRMDLARGEVKNATELLAFASTPQERIAATAALDAARDTVNNIRKEAGIAHKQLRDELRAALDEMTQDPLLGDEGLGTLLQKRRELNDQRNSAATRLEALRSAHPQKSDAELLKMVTQEVTKRGNTVEVPVFSEAEQLALGSFEEQDSLLRSKIQASIAHLRTFGPSSQRAGAVAGALGLSMPELAQVVALLQNSSSTEEDLRGAIEVIQDNLRRLSVPLAKYGPRVSQAALGGRLRSVPIPERSINRADYQNLTRDILLLNDQIIFVAQNEDKIDAVEAKMAIELGETSKELADFRRDTDLGALTEQRERLVAIRQTIEGAIKSGEGRVVRRNPIANLNLPRDARRLFPGTTKRQEQLLKAFNDSVRSVFARLEAGDPALMETLTRALLNPNFQPIDVKAEDAEIERLRSEAASFEAWGRGLNAPTVSERNEQRSLLNLINQKVRERNAKVRIAPVVNTLQAFMSRGRDVGGITPLMRQIMEETFRRSNDDFTASTGRVQGFSSIEELGGLNQQEERRLRQTVQEFLEQASVDPTDVEAQRTFFQNLVLAQHGDKKTKEALEGVLGQAEVERLRNTIADIDPRVLQNQVMGFLVNELNDFAENRAKTGFDPRRQANLINTRPRQIASFGSDADRAAKEIEEFSRDEGQKGFARSAVLFGEGQGVLLNGEDLKAAAAEIRHYQNVLGVLSKAMQAVQSSSGRAKAVIERFNLTPETLLADLQVQQGELLKLVNVQADVERPNLTSVQGIKAFANRVLERFRGQGGPETFDGRLNRIEELIQRRVDELSAAADARGALAKALQEASTKEEGRRAPRAAVVDRGELLAATKRFFDFGIQGDKELEEAIALRAELDGRALRLMQELTKPNPATGAERNLRRTQTELAALDLLIRNPGATGAAALAGEAPRISTSIAKAVEGVRKSETSIEEGVGRDIEGRIGALALSISDSVHDLNAKGPGGRNVHTFSQGVVHVKKIISDAINAVGLDAERLVNEGVALIVGDTQAETRLAFGLVEEGIPFRHLQGIRTPQATAARVALENKELNFAGKSEKQIEAWSSIQAGIERLFAEAQQADSLIAVVPAALTRAEAFGDATMRLAGEMILLGKQVELLTIDVNGEIAADGKRVQEMRALAVRSAEALRAQKGEFLRAAAQAQDVEGLVRDNTGRVVVAPGGRRELQGPITQIGTTNVSFKQLRDALSSGDLSRFGFNLAQDIGRNIVAGVVGALDSGARSVNDNVHRLIKDHIIRPAKDDLEIHSPSAVFYDIGLNVLLGLRRGLEAVDLRVDANRLVESITERVRGAIKLGLIPETELRNAVNTVAQNTVEQLQTQIARLQTDLGNVARFPVGSEQRNVRLAAVVQLQGAIDSLQARFPDLANPSARFEGRAQDDAEASLQKVLDAAALLERSAIQAARQQEHQEAVAKARQVLPGLAERVAQLGAQLDKLQAERASLQALLEGGTLTPQGTLAAAERLSQIPKEEAALKAARASSLKELKAAQSEETKYARLLGQTSEARDHLNAAEKRADSLASQNTKAIRDQEAALLDLGRALPATLTGLEGRAAQITERIAKGLNFKGLAVQLGDSLKGSLLSTLSSNKALPGLLPVAGGALSALTQLKGGIGAGLDAAGVAGLTRSSQALAENRAEAARLTAQLQGLRAAQERNEAAMGRSTTLTREQVSAWALTDREIGRVENSIVKLNKDFEQLNRGGIIENIVARLRGLNDMGKDGRGFFSGRPILQSAFGSILGFASLHALNLLQGGMISLNDAFIGFNARIQSAQAGLTLFLHSQEKAQKLIQDLTAFALATPFNFDQVLEGTKRLLAMGTAADQVLPIFRTLGTAVAAIGGDNQRETLNRVILAFGQIQAKNVVISQDLRQLAEAGIPAFAILQQKLHLTAAQVFDIGRQAIDSRAGVKALLDGMNEAFGGAALIQLDTFNGRLNNLKDVLSVSFAKLGQPLTHELQLLFEDLGNLFQDQGLNSSFTVLGNIIGKLAANIREFVEGGEGGLLEFFRVLPTLIDTVGTKFKEFQILFSHGIPINLNPLSGSFGSPTQDARIAGEMERELALVTNEAARAAREGGKVASFEIAAQAKIEHIQINLAKDAQVDNADDLKRHFYEDTKKLLDGLLPELQVDALAKLKLGDPEQMAQRWFDALSEPAIKGFSEFQDFLKTKFLDLAQGEGTDIPVATLVSGFSDVFLREAAKLSKDMSDAQIEASRSVIENAVKTLGITDQSLATALEDLPAFVGLTEQLDKLTQDQTAATAKYHTELHKGEATLHSYQQTLDGLKKARQADHDANALQQRDIQDQLDAVNRATELQDRAFDLQARTQRNRVESLHSQLDPILEQLDDAKTAAEAAVQNLQDAQSRTNTQFDRVIQNQSRVVRDLTDQRNAAEAVYAARIDEATAAEKAHAAVLKAAKDTLQEQVDLQNAEVDAIERKYRAQQRIDDAAVRATSRQLRDAQFTFDRQQLDIEQQILNARRAGDTNRVKALTAQKEQQRLDYENSTAALRAQLQVQQDQAQATKDAADDEERAAKEKLQDLQDQGKLRIDALQKEQDQLSANKDALTEERDTALGSLDQKIKAQQLFLDLMQRNQQDLQLIQKDELDTLQEQAHAAAQKYTAYKDFYDLVFKNEEKAATALSNAKRAFDETQSDKVFDLNQSLKALQRAEELAQRRFDTDTKPLQDEIDKQTEANQKLTDNYNQQNDNTQNLIDNVKVRLDQIQKEIDKEKEYQTVLKGRQDLQQQASREVFTAATPEVVLSSRNEIFSALKGAFGDDAAGRATLASFNQRLAKAQADILNTNLSDEARVAEMNKLLDDFVPVITSLTKLTPAQIAAALFPQGQLPKAGFNPDSLAFFANLRQGGDRTLASEIAAQPGFFKDLQAALFGEFQVDPVTGQRKQITAGSDTLLGFFKNLPKGVQDLIQVEFDRLTDPEHFLDDPQKRAQIRTKIEAAFRENPEMFWTIIASDPTFFENLFGAVQSNLQGANVEAESTWAQIQGLLNKDRDKAASLRKDVFKNTLGTSEDVAALLDPSNIDFGVKSDAQNALQEFMRVRRPDLVAAVKANPVVWASIFQLLDPNFKIFDRGEVEKIFVEATAAARAANTLSFQDPFALGDQTLNAGRTVTPQPGQQAQRTFQVLQSLLAGNFSPVDIDKALGLNPGETAAQQAQAQAEIAAFLQAQIKQNGDIARALQQLDPATMKALLEAIDPQGRFLKTRDQNGRTLIDAASLVPSDDAIAKRVSEVIGVAVGTLGRSRATVGQAAAQIGKAQIDGIGYMAGPAGQADISKIALSAFQSFQGEVYQRFGVGKGQNLMTQVAQDLLSNRGLGYLSDKNGGLVTVAGMPVAIGSTLYNELLKQLHIGDGPNVYAEVAQALAGQNGIGYLTDPHTGLKAVVGIGGDTADALSASTASSLGVNQNTGVNAFGAIAQSLLGAAGFGFLTGPGVAILERLGLAVGTAFISAVRGPMLGSEGHAGAVDGLGTDLATRLADAIVAGFASQGVNLQKGLQAVLGAALQGVIQGPPSPPSGATMGVSVGGGGFQNPLGVSFSTPSGGHFQESRTLNGRLDTHEGVDLDPLGPDRNPPVYAIADGVVTFAGWQDGDDKYHPFNGGMTQGVGFGQHVRIQHSVGGRRLTSIYGHLSKIEGGITRGVVVRKGQRIGYVGTTGASTGPHLHLQVNEGGNDLGQGGVPIDPFSIVPSTPANLRTSPSASPNGVGGTDTSGLPTGDFTGDLTGVGVSERARTGAQAAAQLLSLVAGQVKSQGGNFLDVVNAFLSGAMSLSLDTLKRYPLLAGVAMRDAFEQLKLIMMEGGFATLSDFKAFLEGQGIIPGPGGVRLSSTDPKTLAELTTMFEREMFPNGLPHLVQNGALQGLDEEAISKAWVEFDKRHPGLREAVARAEVRAGRPELGALEGADAVTADRTLLPRLVALINQNRDKGEIADFIKALGGVPDTASLREAIALLRLTPGDPVLEQILKIIQTLGLSMDAITAGQFKSLLGGNTDLGLQELLAGLGAGKGKDNFIDKFIDALTSGLFPANMSVADLLSHIDTPNTQRGRQVRELLKALYGDRSLMDVKQLLFDGNNQLFPSLLNATDTQAGVRNIDPTTREAARRIREFALAHQQVKDQNGQLIADPALTTALSALQKLPPGSTIGALLNQFANVQSDDSPLGQFVKMLREIAAQNPNINVDDLRGLLFGGEGFSPVDQVGATKDNTDALDANTAALLGAQNIEQIDVWKALLREYREQAPKQTEAAQQTADNTAAGAASGQDTAKNTDDTAKSTAETAANTSPLADAANKAAQDQSASQAAADALTNQNRATKLAALASLDDSLTGEIQKAEAAGDYARAKALRAKQKRTELEMERLRAALAAQQAATDAVTGGNGTPADAAAEADFQRRHGRPPGQGGETASVVNNNTNITNNIYDSRNPEETAAVLTARQIWAARAAGDRGRGGIPV